MLCILVYSDKNVCVVIDYYWKRYEEKEKRCNNWINNRWGFLIVKVNVIVIKKIFFFINEFYLIYGGNVNKKV